MRGHDQRRQNVVDIQAEVHDLPMIDSESVDQVLTVNLIDHLRFQDLPVAVAEWHRVLKPGGELIIDVGNAVGNAQLLVQASDREALEWALRLFYCHSRDPYDSHHWGFTPTYLEELMAGWGFAQRWTTTAFIEHSYPAFQSCFTKPAASTSEAPNPA